MKYQMIFLLCFGIRNTFQDDHLCYNKTTVRRDVCCNNYEWSEGKCNKCKIGTTTEAGDRCLSCQNDFYGEKCAQKCRCDETERCDSKVGCIPNTNSTTTNITETTFDASSNGIDSANAGSVTKIGTSKADWIIYTLCITTCVCITGFGHCFLTYRKRRSLEVRAITATTVSEPFTPDIGNYTEVDKTPLTFIMTGSNVATKTSHNETINFVIRESQSYSASKDDDGAGYFDLYFDMKKDVDHEEEHHTLQKKTLSMSSFNSIVFSQDNTEFHITLPEYCQKDAHACEVSVTVHERQNNTACNEDDEAGYFAEEEHVNQKVKNIALRQKSLTTNSFNSNDLSQDSAEFHDSFSESCLDDARVRYPLRFIKTNLEQHVMKMTNLYLAMKEDVNEQVENHVMRKESLTTTSFNSNFVSKDNSEIHKPLQERYQKDIEMNSQANANRFSPDKNIVHA